MTKPRNPTPLQPRPHQIDALTDLERALAVHDRAQLIMACGAGKTLVGRWHAQATHAEQVLVLLPSLALVAQTLREWRRPAGWGFEALVVCSDPTTSAGAAERHLDDEDQVGVDDATWSQVRADVTTDPHKVTRFLQRHKAGRPQVVFSTYHSAPVVAAAQARTELCFDLAVCDEAHRLAGRPREAFRAALDPRQVVSRKRLFMTATPRSFDGTDEISMDDPRVFGPVAHTVTFGQAISAGLLADYQVLVVAAREDQPATDERDPSTIPASLIDAIDEHRIRRVLTFHGRVAKAAGFAHVVDGETTPAGRRIAARHVSGTMPTDQRTRALDWLSDRDDPEVRVVANARCLSEGVDVPAVDAIMFADQRSSVVDIIQAVGRVLRPSPGKTRGTIVLPVTLPADGDDDSTLATSVFAHVWAVLRGLRSHDQRLAAEIDHAVSSYAKKRNDWAVRRGGLDRIQFLLPDDVDAPALQLRLIQEVGSIWERNYALLQVWAADNPDRLLPRGGKVGTVNLGEWAEQQRLAHRHGMLPQDRASRLGQVPGWSWDKAETRWALTFELLQAIAVRDGDVAEHPSGESRFTGIKALEMPRRALGVWMAEQRQAHRLGTLNPDKIAALEELPGWTWDGNLPEADVAMVEALGMFADFEKHARVPDDHMEDGLRLGAWCWAIRRRRFTGRLAPGLLDEILAATPSQDRPKTRFPWEHTETQWRHAYFALRQYTEREGTATPTGNHTEQLPDGAVNVGQWCALQRLKQRRGELDDQHLQLLDALPGWRWEVPLQRIHSQPPVDLPPGCEHGGAGAFQTYGCRCDDCIEYRRNLDRVRLAERRQLKNPVPAAAVRRHLQALEEAGALRTVIATVSGVSIGVVRKVMRDETDEVEREHALRLAAVTTSMCYAANSKVGSRGRLIAESNDRIDPGPTWQLLDDLAERGFGITWVGRELGYTSAPQISRHTSITRRIADAIAALHAQVGDLEMPPLAKSDARPRLAELQRQARHNNPERRTA